MEKLYNYIIETLNKAIKLSLTFLCLGVIIQLLIDDLLNWDPMETFKMQALLLLGLLRLLFYISYLERNKLMGF